MSALIAILIFFACIYLHEFGHFIAAKHYRIPVITLSVGFGPRLFEKRIGDTLYALSLFPLGGYVRTKLRITEDDCSPDKHGNIFVPISEKEKRLMKDLLGERTELETEMTLRQELTFLVCGPMANFLIAFLSVFLYITEFARYPSNTSDSRAYAIRDSPAADAGVTRGDLIVAVNGTPTTYWSDIWQGLYRAGSGPVSLSVRRKGNPSLIHMNFSPQPVDRERFSEGDYGWHYDTGLRPVVYTRNVGIVDRLFLSWSTVGELALFELKLLLRLNTEDEKSNKEERRISKWQGPLAGKHGDRDLTDFGLRGLVNAFGNSYEKSSGEFFFLIAMFNVLLAIFNLLPVPALDGGQMLLCTLHRLFPFLCTIRVARKMNEYAFGFIMSYSVLLLLLEVVFYYTEHWG